jgi:hypothetical protein
MMINEFLACCYSMKQACKQEGGQSFASAVIDTRDIHHLVTHHQTISSSPATSPDQTHTAMSTSTETPTEAPTAPTAPKAESPPQATPNASVQPGAPNAPPIVAAPPIVTVIELDSDDEMQGDSKKRSVNGQQSDDEEDKRILKRALQNGKMAMRTSE